MNNPSTTENLVGLGERVLQEVKNLLAQPDNAGKQFRVRGAGQLLRHAVWHDLR